MGKSAGRRRRLLSSGAAVACVSLGLTVALAACSTPVQSPAPATDGQREHDFLPQAQDARRDAVAAGSTEAQLAVIDTAIAGEDITLGQIQSLLDDLGRCVEDAGMLLIEQGVSTSGGFPYPDFAVQMSQPGGEPVADALLFECEDRTFTYASMLYQTQPSAVEAGEAAFERSMPDLIACLQEGGVRIDAETSADELKQTMLAFMREHTPKAGDPGVTEDADGNLSWGSGAESPQMTVVPTCLGAVGLQGF